MLLLKALFIVLLSRGLQAQEEDDGPSVKIVGGQQAANGAYPFMASLRRANSNSHFCGGTIVTLRFILTAAHCFPSIQASEIVVYVGTNSLSSGGTRYSVSKIIKHSGYNSKTFVNDIALIQLKSNIKTSNTVKPVTINSKCLDNSSTYAVTAVGWGYKSSTNPVVSNTLQYVNLKTRTQNECKNSWSDFGSNQICTVYPSKGVCSGDSGGPLLYQSQQIGITSYGNAAGCATNAPDVYTKVCSYISWISKNTIVT